MYKENIEILLKKEFSIIFFSLILLSSSIITNPHAFAHNDSNTTDPPGPYAPKIKVKVILDSIKLNENHDDPIDGGEAELVFSYAFNHKGHDENFKDKKDYDHNYMDYRLTTCHSESRPDSTWSCYRWFEEPEKDFRNEVLYEHIECSEMSPILYSFDLRESDQSNANTAASGLLAVGSAIVAVPKFGWVAGGIAIAVGGLLTFVIGLNGDEHLGIKLDVQEKPQSNIVTKLQGADGGAEIRWSVITEPVDDPNGECLAKEVASSIQIPATDQYALATSVNDFISSSKDVIRLNSDSQKEEGLTETTDLEFEELKQKTPNIVVDYAGVVYDVISSESDSRQKSTADQYALEAESLASQGNYLESLDKYEDAFLTIYDIKSKEESALPSWIKTSAQWWAGGIVSDREFATSLAFLVKEKIVQVDNVEVDPQGTIAISDNIAIPQWIRNNADWWVSGAISDSDFKQGIQFMMKEEIISFKEKQKQPDTIKISQDFFFNLYKEQKWNEVAFNYLLQIKNYEAKIYNRASDTAWNLYSEEKFLENQKLAEKIQTLKTKGDEDVQKALEILKNSQRQIETLKNIAKQNNISVLDLERSTEEQNSLLDSPLKFHGLNDVFEGYDVAQEAVNNAQLHHDLMGEIPTSKSDIRIELDTEDDVDIQIIAPGYCGPSEKCDDLGDDMIKNGDTVLRSSVGDLEKVLVLDSGESIPVSPTNEAEDLHDTPDEETEVNDSDYDTSDEETEMEQSSITILEIGGAQYPIAQFTLWQWKGECDDAWHYHTSSGHAVNLELTGIGDPDPENCGFGKLSEINSYNTWLTQNQIDTFYELTGINPAGNEAQMGGSGP